MLESIISNMITNSDNIINDDIAKSFSEGREITRKFNITSTCELVGISTKTMYGALKDGRLSGELFDNWKPATGATVYQIDAMREVFERYPYQVNKLAGCIVEAVSGHKGGGWKSTTVAHQAQWLSMRGYRVLVVSMDPQGSLNAMFGMLPDTDIKGEDTLLPFFYGQEKTAHYAIKNTYWPKLDIIPSCLQFGRVEGEIARLGDEDKLNHPAHLLLKEALDTVKDNYDLIIIDGAPNLGLGTVNCVFAADLIICPSPSEALGFLSTRQYLQMFKELLQPFGDEDHQPIFKVLATHVENAATSDSRVFLSKLKEAWGHSLLENPLIRTPQVPTGYNKGRTIYEQQTKEKTSWAAHKKATGIFDDVFQEILDKLLLLMWGVK